MNYIYYVYFKYLNETICVEHLFHDPYSILLSDIGNLCNVSFLGETLHQMFHFRAQSFLVSSMNFVDGLGLEVLRSKSFGLIVRRFGITARICNALFGSLKRFGGRTIEFITVVTAVVITITLITDRNASVVGGAGKPGWVAGVTCSERYCAIGIIGGEVRKPVPS